MGKTTITKYYCDVCGAEVQERELHTSDVPVLVHAINEYGNEAYTHIFFRTVELCEDCLDRITVLETNEGMVCRAHGEGEYRMRKPKEVDG